MTGLLENHSNIDVGSRRPRGQIDLLVKRLLLESRKTEGGNGEDACETEIT